MKPAVLVAGAANLDRMMYVERIPKLGETVMANRYEEHPGGKGANQAAACALWGQPTYFLGKLGRDEPGRILSDALRRSGVEMEFLVQGDSASGLALDFVDAQGHYQAGVMAGANEELGPENLPRESSFWDSLGLTVLQLECPLPFVEAAGLRSWQYHVPVLLNAAPAAPFPESWWEWISVLVVNELEAESLSGVPVADRAAALNALGRLSAHCSNVIITLGENGLVLEADGRREILDAPRVDPVSTLGAGDAFVGVFAAEFCRGRDVVTCAEMASIAATASVTSEGAQTSYVRPVELLQHPDLGPSMRRLLHDTHVGEGSYTEGPVSDAG